MGGGVSKQKSRKNLLGAPATENRPKSAVSLHARENIDTFLIFLEEQSFVQVTRAATKIQSCYRRVLAKKVHATLKEHSVSIHEAAARYLENMKDSSKVNRRKTGLRSSRLISSFSQPSKETADVILSYGSKKENEEASPFSFPNQSEKGSAKSASSSMLRPLSVPNPQTEELPEDDGNKDLETNKIVKEEVIEPRTSVKTSVSANRSRKFRFQGGGHSVKGSVRSPRFDTERSMTSVVEVEEEEGFGPDDMAIIASGIDDDEEGTFEKIYPMIGYVIKTRFLHSQRKVFINVCHNASVDRIICSPFREYIDTSHYDDDGYVQSISVAICDILIPSNEFHKAFMFQEGVGLVVKVPPSDERLEKKSKLKEKDMKAVLAEKCLAFLNGLSHCLDEDNPPISGLTDCEDYTVDESYYRLPKMKKMYYGALPLFYYNKKDQILDYYQPLSWNYLVKQMPGSVNRHPMPETYFNHYFIDPFTAQNSEKEDVTNASVDDSKRRVFPPDVQYPMALSYQCLKGEFDPKHPMKSNHGVLAGSTASSMRLDILSSSATVSNNAENNKLQKTPRRVPGAASKRPFSNNLLDLDNDDDDDDIPAHQKLYLESLSKLKTGYPVYMDLSFGIMSLYLTRSGTSAPPGTSLINSSSSPTNNPEQPYVSVPYGETFVARIALSNYVFSTSYDATNVIFYLHLEAEYTPEHSQYNQFLMSHYINEVSENIDLKQLTFQFSEFTELMTMQLIIERHAFYCNYCSSYASSLLPSLSQSIPALEKSSSFREKENKAVNNVTSSSSGRAGSAGSGSAGRAASASLYSYGQIRYDGAPVSHQPASKFFSLVERFSLFPVTRQRRYFKVDRGLIGVFEDDMKITPNWKNALEIIPLTHKRFEVVWHRKIVRLRKVMTKLFLIDERSKRIREFFFKGEGEGDQELQGILTCMTQHIQYANAQPFRYQYHYLEALGLLRRPITANAVSSSPSSELLTVHGFSSQIQIFVPEPHTSDDDSDIDDPSAMSLQDSDDIHDILTLPGDDHINVLHTSSEALIPAPPAPSSILKSGGVAAHRLVNQRSQGSAVPKKEARIVYGSYFRLIRTKTRMRATVKGEPESTGEEAVDSDDDDAKIPNNLEEIIDHWQQRLSEQFGAFSKYFFHCRLYYLEELDLLLILQDYKLISLMRISKILEKPTLSSISGTGASSTSAVMAGAGSNTSNSLALITSNILRRNSTPMKILNKPKPTFPPSIVPSPQPSPVQHQHSSPHIQNLASSSLGASMSSLPHISTNQPSNKTEGKVSSKSSLRLAQGLAPSGISSKLYNLESDESDDEDDANSDRDYEEDDIITNFNTYLANKQTHQPGNSNSNRDNDHSSRNSALSPSNVNSNNKTDLSGSPAIWIFKVLSYDGRTYRFKFHEKSPYDKLTKFFYQHCIKPVVKRDLSFLKVNELQTVEPALPDIVIDNEGTRKYVRLLRPNEKVIAFGTVLKHEKTVPIASSNSSIAVPKQRRVLLVTDAPRMIFIDTIGSIVRGHVELQADGKNQVKVIDGSDFEVSINNTVHRFTSAELPDKDPNYWTLRIKQALSLANK